MEEPRTHLDISHRLCGTPKELGEGRAVVALETTEEMAVDDRGLVHGGFVFGLADHAAMLAVNHPNVTLGEADVRFLLPVVAGETVEAEAVVEEHKGKKRVVSVTGRRGDTEVFMGRMTCFVLSQHVLDRDA